MGGSWHCHLFEYLLFPILLTGWSQEDVLDLNVSDGVYWMFFSCGARHISWVFWSSSWYCWGENMRVDFHGRLSNNCLKKCTDGKHNSRINTVLRSWLCLHNAPAQGWINNLQCSCFTLNVMNFNSWKLIKIILSCRWMSIKILHFLLAGGRHRLLNTKSMWLCRSQFIVYN